MFAGDKKTTAAFHSTSVSFFLQASLGHKCADSVSGKAFFKKTNCYSSFSPEHQVTAGAQEWLLSQLCAGPAGDSSACETKTSWRIPMWWRAHQTTASNWVWLNVRASWAQITGLEGTFPKQSACCVRHLQLRWQKGCNKRSVTSFFFLLLTKKQSYRTEQLCLVPVCL